ncbi:MAG: sigma-70 family RNA polymerase sigma factor, partial [Saprospiraceae bacterium]
MQEINYLSAILSGDRAVLTRMYATLFPAICRMIKENNGSENDARDVFQDAVIVIYEKARQLDFQLTSKFSTFLYGVCYNLWRSQQQKRSASEVTIPEHAKYIPDHSCDVDLLQIERSKLFYRSLRQLGADCQKLLELFFQKQSMDEIARAMGFASEG